MKRKNAWVKRYAIVSNCTFSYKNSQKDNKTKYTADLQKAKVLLGRESNHTPYIDICADPKVSTQAVRVRFES